MGSFTYVTMDAPEGRKLTIISVYRACAGNADASGGTIWKQQWARAQKRGMGQEYDPRTAVIWDLWNFWRLAGTKILYSEEISTALQWKGV